MKKLMLASLLAMLCGATAQAGQIQGTFKFESDDQDRVASAKVIIKEMDEAGNILNKTILYLNPGDPKTNPITFRQYSQIRFVALDPDGNRAQRLDGTNLGRPRRYPSKSKDWTFVYILQEDGVDLSGYGLQQ